MLVELFIPLASNEGETFTADHHAAYEAVLTDLFGGFSRLPGVVTGGWEDEGRIYRDDLVIYAVVLPSLTAGDKVAQAVEAAKAHYGQLAIFIRYLGLSEII